MIDPGHLAGLQRDERGLHGGLCQHRFDALADARWLPAEAGADHRGGLGEANVTELLLLDQGPEAQAKFDRVDEELTNPETEISAVRRAFVEEWLARWR